MKLKKFKNFAKMAIVVAGCLLVGCGSKNSVSIIPTVMTTGPATSTGNVVISSTPNAEFKGIPTAKNDYIVGQGEIYGVITQNMLNTNATEIVQKEHPNTMDFVMCSRDLDEQVGAQVTCQFIHSGKQSLFYIQVDTVDKTGIAHLTMLAGD